MKCLEASSNNNFDDHSEMNTSMDEGSHCSESLMLSSPPTSARGRFSASRPAGGGFGSAASRLFDDDEEECFQKQPSILKPLDLNMEMSVASNYASSGPGGSGGSAPGGSRTPFRNRSSRHHLENTVRKRHAEQQLIARDLSFDDVDGGDDDKVRQDSPVDMMQSPRISPSCYRSPTAYRAAPAHVNKSPCYRTLDGRTVQSKNPFSPMYTDESGAASVATTTAPLSESLNFPVSLESGSFGNTGQGPPLLRHRLQKRDTNLNPSAFPSFAASAAAQYETFTRDGYPERKGRYSFTGSPIREMEFDHPSSPPQQQARDDSMYPIPHKVRRLSKQDDAAAAQSSSQSDAPFYVSLNQEKKPPSRLDIKEATYGVRNKNHANYSWNDEVSPTDVASFPMLMGESSPPSTPVPPTPSKPRNSNYRRRPKTRYTPVRKPAVPQTPMPERRARNNFCSQSTDEDDSDLEMTTGGGNHSRSQSRFHSDFDVIGELGNGSFGNVFKVMSRLDGCMYAIKVAHRPAKGHSDKDRMLKEVSANGLRFFSALGLSSNQSLTPFSSLGLQVYALAALSDQADTATFHIVRYHQAWMEDQRLYIQTELCTTTLSAEIEQHSPAIISVERRYKFLREICLALEFIHRKGMIHLDIKPENVFIKNDQFKLGDFGLVSKVSSHDVEEGDSRYMSRELLSGDHTDLTKSDIFSLGISLYEICLGGVRALPKNGQEWQLLREANFLPLASTPGEMQRIIQLMMNPNFGARPSAHELLKRPQLLSEEQKALLAERNKVVQANLALAEQANRLEKLTHPPIPARKKLLVRANTWNGS